MKTNKILGDKQMYNIDYESLIATGIVIALGIEIFKIKFIIRIFKMTKDVEIINIKLNEIQRLEEQNKINLQQNKKIIDLLQKIAEQNKKE